MHLFGGVGNVGSEPGGFAECHFHFSPSPYVLSLNAFSPVRPILCFLCLRWSLPFAITELAGAALRIVIEQLDFLPDNGLSVADETVCEEYNSLLTFAHRLSDTLLNCASASYTASIQHFEGDKIILQITIIFQKVSVSSVDKSIIRQHTFIKKSMPDNSNNYITKG